MACRGVYFALDPDEASRLDAASDDDELMAMIEGIEERWDRDWLQEKDKAWDTIHRCLTGGTLEYGPTPLHKCGLGEASRHEGDDYIVNLIGPEEVKNVAAAIEDLDEAWMRRTYFALDPEDYDPPLSEVDFGSTWDNFQEVRRFFEKAAGHDRAVIFTVDQ